MFKDISKFVEIKRNVALNQFTSLEAFFRIVPTGWKLQSKPMKMIEIQLYGLKTLFQLLLGIFQVVQTTFGVHCDFKKNIT
jgi:hypothetical protein